MLPAPATNELRMRGVAEKEKAVLLGWGEDTAPPLLLGMRIPGEAIPLPFKKSTANRQNRTRGFRHDVIRNRQRNMSGQILSWLGAHHD